MKINKIKAIPILVFLTVVLFVPFVFSQEDSNVRGNTEGVYARADSTEKTIKVIEVIGNKAISVNSILSTTKTAVGMTYQPRVASEDIKRLYKTGYFSDVSIDLEDYEGGLKVIYNVVERPIIESIVISGASSIKEKQHLKNMETKVGEYLNFNNLKDDVSAIRKSYEEIGFSSSDISYELDIDDELNRANIEIIIVEGQRSRVGKIIIEGNNSFSDKRIIRLIKTRSAWLLNRGLLKQEVLDGDIERIKVFYEREGFLDVAVDGSYYVDAKTKKTVVALQINEGNLYKVGSVTIRGNAVFSEEEIKENLKNSIPGNVFSQEGLLEDLYSMQTVYLNKGYIFAQVKDITSVDPNTGLVDVSFDIVENEVAYVDMIKIRGNVKTKDIVIRRELRIHPGDRFDGDKIKRSRERLYNLGFFAEGGVDFKTEAGMQDNTKDLVVEVKESKTGEFSFGGGYSSVEELVGFVEIAQSNFDWRNWPYFTGDGQDIRLRAQIGSVSNRYDLSFTEPWLFDFPIAGGFDVYKKFHERERDVGYAYDESRQGGDLRLTKEFSEHLSANLMYRREEIDITDIDPTATSDLKKEEGSNTISSLAPGIVYDRRDNIFSPTMGFVIGGNVEVAGGFLGADKDFTKFYGYGSKYFSLWQDSVLELKMRMGLADAFSDTGNVPIYERFYAGGAYSIRGYDERSIGPVDTATEDPIGGNSMLIANIEYIYPFVEFIKGAVFFDTGNVWERIDGFGTGIDDFKSGVGLGVRVKTPIGPIKLDYGFPLDLAPAEEHREGKFHFSFSRGF